MIITEMKKTNLYILKYVMKIIKVIKGDGSNNKIHSRWIAIIEKLNEIVLSL